MVSKITLVEPHFEGTQFGPASVDVPTLGGDGPDEADEEDEEAKSRLGTVLQGAMVFLVLFAVLWTAFSRALGDESGED